MIAPWSEVEAETAQLCAKRGVMFQHGVKDLRYVLSPMERYYNYHYELKWFARSGGVARNEPNLIFGLNDNPLKRVAWSANGKLPTLRTNSDRMFSPWKGRFLTLRERIAAMGFPVYPSLAHASQGQLVQGRHVSTHLAGNAMHLPNVTTILATCLARTRLY